MTLAIVPFFALAITNANPPKNAISTSRISGAVRAKSSEDSSLKGKNLKNKNAVRILSPTITKKFLTDLFNVSISLMPKAIPIPKMGPMRGEINIAPITTAVEFALSPTEAIKIEQTKIQAVWFLKGMSPFISSIVASLSVFFLISRRSSKKALRLPHKPLKFFFTSSLLAPVSLLLLLSVSLLLLSSIPILNDHQNYLLRSEE